MVKPFGRRKVEDMEVYPAKLVRESPSGKAWLFRIYDADVWLPKSQVEWMAEEGEVWIPDWIAEEKGLV